MNMHEYTYINLSYLYEIADGDINFVKEMLTDYVEKVPEQFAELQQAFASDNIQQAHFIAHKIRSSFQFVGAAELVDLTLQIEAVNKPEDMAGMGQKVKSMEPVVKSVLQELQHQLSTL